MILTGNNRRTRTKLVPAPLCPPPTSHGQSRDRKRDSTTKIQRQTTSKTNFHVNSTYKLGLNLAENTICVHCTGQTINFTKKQFSRNNHIFIVKRCQLLQFATCCSLRQHQAQNNKNVLHQFSHQYISVSQLQRIRIVLANNCYITT